MTSPVIYKTLVAAALFILPSLQAAHASDPIEEWGAKVRSKIIEHNSYPADALEKGIEGKVMFEFAVAQSGFVKGVKIVESSGNALLDQQAYVLALKMTQLPSLPAGIKEHIVSVPIMYEIKDERDLDAPKPTNLHASVDLADG